MDRASALPAASCERNPAAPRTSSSCSRFEDRSQTGALPPARLDPQSAPHAAPSSRDPRPSSPALCSTQRDICCRIFTPAQPEYPAASVRDNCSGAYISGGGFCCAAKGTALGCACRYFSIGVGLAAAGPLAAAAL